MNKSPSKLISLARIFRLEYIYMLIPRLLIIFFICAKYPSEFFSIPVIEGLIVTYLLIFSGFGANSIVDREIDIKYKSNKNSISMAVMNFGIINSWIIVFLLFFISLLLTAHISIIFESWFPLILVIISCFFGYGYSIPPLHFKVRGLTLHALSLIVSCMLMPPLLSTFTYLGTVSNSRLILFVGGALTIYGLAYCNQAMDYLEDKEEALQTPAVRLGVTKSLKATLIVTPIGMTITFAGFYWLFLERWQNIGDELAQYHFYLAWVLVVFAIFAGYFIPLRNTWKMYRLSKIEPPEIFVPKIPSMCRYPLWQAAGMLGFFTATAIFYATTNFVWLSAG